MSLFFLEENMQYRTHMTTALMVGLPIMAATDTLTIGAVAALSIGAVFPDIDEPNSWIGCRTRGISDLLNTVFGHRGITHSLMGVILVFLTILLMISILGFSFVVGMYFTLGYLLHLIGDSFSKSGVKWLLPFSDQSFQSGLGVIYYRTGSLVENIIFLSSVAILIFQFNHLDFSLIPTNINFNIVDSFTNLIKGVF